MVGHIGFLFTLVFGGVTFIEKYGSIRQFPLLATLYRLQILSPCFMEGLIISTVLSSFLVLTIYILFRIFWWAELSTAITEVSATRPKIDNLFESLSFNARDWVFEQSKKYILDKLAVYTRKKIRWWFACFVLFLISFLLIILYTCCPISAFY